MSNSDKLTLDLVDTDSGLVDRATYPIYYRLALEYIGLHRMLGALRIPIFDEALLEIKRRYPEKEDCDKVLYQEARWNQEELRSGSLLPFRKKETLSAT